MNAVFHMTLHFGRLEVLGPLTERASRAASVKASLTPRLCFAEHSVLALSLSRIICAANLTQVSKGLDAPGHGQAGVVIYIALVY